MLRFALDENFNEHLIRGLQLRKPDLDCVWARDAGLRSANDASVLAWAAGEGRILLTHDVSTIPPLAYARVDAGQPMPGVFAVPWLAPIGQVIEDLLVLVECSLEGEWEGQVQYLPL